MNFQSGDRIRVVSPGSQFDGWRGEVYRVDGFVWARVRSGKYESHVGFQASALVKIRELVTALIEELPEGEFYASVHDEFEQVDVLLIDHEDPDGLIYRIRTKDGAARRLARGEVVDLSKLLF